MLIFDASTLILLAKVEFLDLFLDDFQGIPLMPRAVELESTYDPARPDGLLIQERIREGRLAVEEIQQSTALSRLLQDFRLGMGEAEALLLALEKGDAAVVATDDRNAIRACRVLRISFVTSLGILTRSVDKGLLAPADGLRLLDRLQRYGRFKAEILEDVARQIGGTAHGQKPEDS